MGYFSQAFTTSSKADHSPVTEVDIAANQLIVNALREMAPEIAVIAEEDETLGREDHELFFLVDPLDGTRSFVRGEPEFTVNIGLIQHRRPVFGVIYAPVSGLLYWNEVGGGAFKQEGQKNPVAISARETPSDGLVLMRSRANPSATASAYLLTLPIKEIIPSSSSIKFCHVAEGSADLYPRFGRTMEWDTAAGHAIVSAAGGRVETVDGKPLMYGKSGFENPPFIAYGK